MESALKKMCLIQWALLLAIALFAVIAELSLEGSGSRDWNWRHWLLLGYAVYAASVALRFRRTLSKRSLEKIRNGGGDAQASEAWQAGIFS